MNLPGTSANMIVTCTAIVFVCSCFLLQCTQANICSTANTAKQNENIVVRGPDSGTVTSQNFPNSFPAADLICRWKFFAPPGHIVKLYVDTIDLDIGVFNCITFPYLDIYDGLKDKKAPKLVSIKCRSNPLKESLKPSFFLISSGDSMEIFFQSLKSGLHPIKKTGHGFSINYSFEPLDTSGTCGEGLHGVIVLKGQGARFSSPDYKSSKNLKNMTCLWNITADPGFIIEIDTLSINLNTDCKTEFVKVYDGASLKSPILGTMCKEIPDNYLYSTGNRIIVQMKISSSEKQGKGFQMSYRAVKYERPDYPCNIADKKQVIKVDKSPGKIMSPWYPTSYPNNAFCRWTFNSPSFSGVGRVTINRLKLQNSMSCKADFVRIYGKDEFSMWPQLVRIETLCGTSKTPQVFSSSGRYLEIYFKSDWIKQNSGFEAVFDSIEDVSFRGCNVQGQDNYLPLNSSNGKLFSPRYPKPIPPNMMCTWVITAKPSSYVRLQFIHFRFSDVCTEGSSVEIRDGASVKSKLLGTYCGFNMPRPVFSSQQDLWVRFTSRSKISIFDKGFAAVYNSVKSLPLPFSCRDDSLQNSEASSGQIASYEYPLNYRNNTVCTWRIYPSAWGKRMKLTFDSFHIKDSPGCSEDFVEVFDGWDEDDKSLGRFCGDKKPEPVYSTGTLMYIRFQAGNQTGQYQGFKASFETVLNKTSIILIAVGCVVGVLMILGIVIYVYCKHRRSQPGTSTEMENLK